MSTSRHPIALALERRVGSDIRLLAAVMGLALVDGMFPAIVLAGGLDTWVGVVQVGLLVFGGSATLAVILAEMDRGTDHQVRAVLTVGVPLVALAVLEAALAPTLASLLSLAVFERFAAVVLLTVAAKAASARIGEYLPEPWVVVALGVVASLRPGEAALVLSPDPSLLLRAGAAALVGVGFALSLALAGGHLRGLLDIDRFRFGSAVALGVLGLQVVGLVPANPPLPLAVLGVTALLSFDPDADARDDGSEPAAADPEPSTGPERLPWQ
jgi:hypothetical protein